MSDLKPIPWDSLTPEQQHELVRGADSRIFWKMAWTKVSWLKGPLTLLFLIVAAWSLFWEAAAEQLQRVINK